FTLDIGGKHMKYDEVDKKLLEELTKNGRISYVELSEKVNLSRVAVKGRIDNLIKEGVIEKFSAIINSEKIGKNVSAFFDIDVATMKLQTVAQSLADHPNVASVYQMTGPSTLHMHVLVEDFNQLEIFINNELYSVNGVTRVDSQVLLKRFKS